MHPQYHRRRTDSRPAITIHHGSNKLCPDVTAGRATRCMGHAVDPVVPPETADDHLRNVMMVVRCCMDVAEIVIVGSEPNVLVPLATLAAIQSRTEAALSLLPELDGRSVCVRCKGTILAPTIRGVPRGTCHCPREPGRFTWTDQQIDHAEDHE